MTEARNYVYESKTVPGAVMLSISNFLNETAKVTPFVAGGAGLLLGGPLLGGIAFGLGLISEWRTLEQSYAMEEYVINHNL